MKQGAALKVPAWISLKSIPVRDSSSSTFQIVTAYFPELFEKKLPIVDCISRPITSRNEMGSVIARPQGKTLASVTAVEIVAVRAASRFPREANP